jgi:hypothetical protein
VDAFDEASLRSADPREVSLLAAQAITLELMKEWAAVLVRRRPTPNGTAAAWTRLLFHCVELPTGLVERVAVRLARGAVGGRAAW